MSTCQINDRVIVRGSLGEPTDTGTILTIRAVHMDEIAKRAFNTTADTVDHAYLRLEDGKQAWFALDDLRPA